VADRRTMVPLPASLAAYSRFVDIAYENGLIVYSRRTRGGYEGDHILVCPPMIVNENQVEEIIEMLDRSLKQFMGEVHTALPQSA
jgi:adenosylmethionine-8-amino-7-oxononanoate aminotransferase